MGARGFRVIAPLCVATVARGTSSAAVESETATESRHVFDSASADIDGLVTSRNFNWLEDEEVWRATTHLRRLPGSKVSYPVPSPTPTPSPGGSGSWPSPTPTPSPSPVNCYGYWGSWGACSGTQRTRTYIITQQAAYGGASCTYYNGEVQTQACANCIGTWGSWGACDGTQRVQTYTITQQSSNGGSACAYSNGQTQASPCANCIGSWSAWSSCSSSQQTRTYSISQQSSNGGASCPYSSGYTDAQTCTPASVDPTVTTVTSVSTVTTTIPGTVTLTVATTTLTTTTPATATVIVTTLTTQTSECIGQWGPWSECSDSGTTIRSFVVLQPVSSCPLAGAVESQPCTKIIASWDYVIPKSSWDSFADGDEKTELPLIVCPLNGTVNFRWNGTHDMWKLPDETAYVNCDFDHPQSAKIAMEFTQSEFIKVPDFKFQCTQPGTHFFACSIDDACNVARQRVRVHVTDPSKVYSLGGGGVDPVTGQPVPSMASIMEHDIINVDYNGFDSDAQAAEIVTKLQSALRHSPLSCADWIPAYALSNASCVASLASDLGFVMRARPNYDAQASKAFYQLSLQSDPAHCGTLSYLAELEAQENRYNSAMQVAATSCVLCGVSLDVLSIIATFGKKGWPMPSECSASLPASLSPQVGQMDDETGTTSKTCSADTSILSLCLAVTFVLAATN